MKQKMKYFLLFRTETATLETIEDESKHLGFQNYLPC